MDIHFLGVGEACDGTQPNTSMLIKKSAADTAGRILLDCGFTVPHLYLSLDPDPHELEILWISHFHGDHFFGTPLLLLWFWETGRKKPFQIVGPPGIETRIRQAMELAYPTLMNRFGFELLFTEMEEGGPKKIEGSLWQTAYNEHSQPCLALRLELQDKAVFYSGDGRPTPATQTLAQGCDMIIHEAYGLKDTTPGHGSITTCLEFCRKAGGNRLALLHLQRDIRLQAETILADLAEKYSGINILIPEPGTIVTL